MFLQRTLFLSLLAARYTYASPAPTKTVPRVVDIQERDVISSVVSAVTNIPSEVQNVFSSIGESVPTQAAAGVLPGLDVPSIDDIKQKAGLDDNSINQLPIRILNIACVPEASMIES
jgi:hypothetical protein